MIIDATDTILGRLASNCAKKALKGEKIIIINSEKAIVSGTKTDILLRYKFKRDVGSTTKGPYYSRMSDRIVRRTIRGMLPRKTSRGKEALKNIEVHIGRPEDITGEPAKLEKVGKTILQNQKYTSIEQISKWLGAR